MYVISKQIIWFSYYLLNKIPYCKAQVWLKFFIVYLPVMPQFSLTVVPTLVQGLRCVVENHEIPENNGLAITNISSELPKYFLKITVRLLSEN